MSQPQTWISLNTIWPLIVNQKNLISQIFLYLPIANFNISENNGCYMFVSKVFFSLSSNINEFNRNNCVNCMTLFWVKYTTVHIYTWHSSNTWWILCVLHCAIYHWKAEVVRILMVYHPSLIWAINAWPMHLCPQCTPYW